jgi:hypothetical protein
MKSFLEGRQVVSRDGSPSTRLEGQLPSFDRPAEDSTVARLPQTSPAARHDHSDKKIETVEVDGVVQKIIVICGCGEKIEVHCGY